LLPEGGGYFFLLWNLFLAAVPYALSILYERVASRSSALSWKVVPLFLLWLFFFPNAPYIVTDFTHLPWGYPVAISAPFLFDFSLVAIFAGTGMLFGLGSLFLVQRTLRKLIGGLWAGSIAWCAILLSGIGIYLGRFLRWNSWDMLLNPVEVLGDTFSHYGDPAWFARAIFLSAMFSAFTAISYLLFLGAHWVLQREEE
jgi:uncharacterized membrane protein